ncbi:MAG: EAL domain-containing protein [Acidovorax sp.]|uniref:putative bifunctional diguanylate cyclase/phosphodiesterase n=1 Tax=Acidovorax sp. TaxID=1872122 RepID=UPI0039E2CC90
MLPLSPRASVIRQLSLSIWGLFLALLVLLSVLGYTAMRIAANRVAPAIIQQIVQLQALASEGLFLHAERSVQRLREELLQRLDGDSDTAATLRRFDTLFERSADGLWRLRPGLVDTQHAPTLYLHHGPAGPDESTRRRAVASFDLLRQQGPAMVPPFFSVYMDFVEDGLMVYTRGINWGAGAAGDATNANYPTMRGADPRNNPQRTVFWTPVYYDQQAKAWMVSVIQPFDWQGRWVGTLGHDLPVDALIRMVTETDPDDGLQLILSADGDLIAHPHLRERIAQTDGQLRIATLQDPLLDQIHGMVTQARTDSGAGLSPDGSQWVAWSRIHGPGWFRVQLLPQSRVNGFLMCGLAALFAIGLLGLVPVLWLLRRQVDTLVQHPLQRIALAVDELGEGRTPTPIGAHGDDELGRLARAFDGMVAELDQQRTLQAHTAEQLAYLAERDALTGLYNRRRFEDELARFFKERERRPREGALLFLDLDEFKYINDTFGHRAGDAMLVRVTAEVRALVRETEVLARLGGDEFAVLMPDATESDARKLAERIVQAIAQMPFSIGDQTLRLTASLGIAHVPTHADNAEDLVAHADAAMYQAKHAGKNRWSTYSQNSDASYEMITRLAWNDRIGHALDHGRMRLHYQGVYQAGGNELSHLEALIRMVDDADTARLIAPSEFIGYAEKSGKILDIDRWVIRRSIAQLAQCPHLPAIAINISGRSFDDPDLPRYIAEHLQSASVAPSRLIVELTETSAVSDLRDAERFIDALHRTGCHVCLDDFGTGFASFAYLKHLKVDILKIDGLFIRNLPSERDNQVFVRAIIDVARGLGKRTVAEFVENHEVLLMLQAFGVDMVQGYHLDKPQERHPALMQPPGEEGGSHILSDSLRV